MSNIVLLKPLWGGSLMHSQILLLSSQCLEANIALRKLHTYNCSFAAYV